jgi:transposase
VSTLDHKLESEVTTVRRLEVITATGRRRQFTEDFKAQVVGETLASGAVVSEVARRYGLTPQQVFTWRRQARQAAPRVPRARRRRSCRRSWKRHCYHGRHVKGGASGRTWWIGPLEEH